jgi:hypothetical protein
VLLADGTDRCNCDTAQPSERDLKTRGAMRVSRTIVVALLAWSTACYQAPVADGKADSTAPPVTSPAADVDSTPMAETGVALRTDKSSYKAGDPLTLTIVNGTASKYYFNPCTRILERESGTTWTEVREDRMCTMIAHVLDAKATRTERTELSDGLAPGRYRVVVLFTEENPSGPAKNVRASAVISVT